MFPLAALSAGLTGLVRPQLALQTQTQHGLEKSSEQEFSGPQPGGQSRGILFTRHLPGGGSTWAQEASHRSGVVLKHMN